MCCGDIIHGAAGLAKAAIGIDAVPMQIMLNRRDICRECPHATRSPSPRYAVNKGLTTLSQCTQCRCIIAAKTKLAGERCPIGKWEAFTAA